jgi:hypothetical protein
MRLQFQSAKTGSYCVRKQDVFDICKDDSNCLGIQERYHGRIEDLKGQLQCPDILDTDT